MESYKIYRLFVLLIVTASLWRVSQKSHQAVRLGDSDALRLPIILGYIFGRSSPEGLHSIGGIAGQLFVLSIAVVFSLNILEVVPKGEWFKYLFILEIVAAFVLLILFLLFRRH